MRLTTVILIACLMQLSAATKAQKVSMNETNASLQTIIKELRKQTGYDFVYKEKLLKAFEPVNIHVKQEELEAVLASIFKDQALTFSIDEKTVVIKEKPSLIETMKEKVKETLNLFRADSVVFKGTVVDEKGLPMPGATVRVKGKKTATKSKENGDFAILAPVKGTLVISFIGYKDQEITLLGLDEAKPVNVMMQVGQDDLEEVTIASNGYQDIPKERSTGSFEVITAKQLQHSNDPNLIRRLEGLTTSMDFSNQFRVTNSAQSKGRQGVGALTIRGRNSLQNSTAEVLVVIDGIPSPYDISNVNPNDVENITILKDAAAASIWGSRAANGVIVVKTKKGKYNRPMNISFNSNFNVTEKMDLFYRKAMSVSDYIDAQVKSYGFNYDPANPDAYLPDPTRVTRRQPIYSPVFEIMNDWKKSKGAVTIAERDARLDALRGNDVRNDFTKYFLRNAVQQSYSLGLDGGSDKRSYRLSAGYDHITENTQGASENRLTLNYNTSIKVLKNLELLGNASYVLSRTQDNSSNSNLTGAYGSFYPYTRLADDQGTPLEVSYKYRPIFNDLLKATYGNRILNTDYVPLEDYKEGYYNSRGQTIALDLTARYTLSSVFSADVTYNYVKGLNNSEDLTGQNSFYMRELINYYTDPVTFNRGLRLGDMYRPSNSNSTNQLLRGQLNVNKEWGSKHALYATVGVDASDLSSIGQNYAYYGYNESTLDYQKYGPDTMVPILFNNSSARLPDIPIAFGSSRLRTFSSFANAAYTYNQRYIVSGSIRRDGSSDLGRGTNRAGTPFYSAGLSWNIANEGFYHWSLVPRLSLRATFGYNGNTSPLVRSTAQLYYFNRTDIFGNIQAASSGTNIPNLRPEKTGVTNFALDFGLRNNRISGSIEYYDKRTSDLMAQAPVDPSSGYDIRTYNVADMHGWGTELTLNSVNFRTAKFSWNSNFLFSYNRVKVTDVFSDRPQTASEFVTTPEVLYNKGYDLSRLFAYSWGGLDPQTGDPRGMLDGQPVRIDNTQQGFDNVVAIYNSPGTSSSIKYFGSSIPVYFGSLRNTFSYDKFTLSVGLLYKLGYYFRNSTAVRYDALYSQNALLSDAYNQRWKKPGDEQYTDVPSLTFPSSELRDYFYLNSAVNVLKGDHVRLQELNLGYTFGAKAGFLKSPRLYANLPMNVIIWRANKLGIDPETADVPIPRSYSLGFSASF